MKRLTQFIPPLIMGAVFMAPVALAQTIKPTDNGKAIRLSDVVDVAQTIMSTFITIAAILMVLGVVYTGMRMILARGDDKEYGAAKAQLWQVIVGSFVILAVWLILNSIANFAKDPVRAITGSGGQQQESIAVPQDDSRFGTPF